MAASIDGQSALIVPVALPPALDQLRDRFDPSAAEGVPGHITLLYPFVPADNRQDEVLTRVAQIVSGTIDSKATALSQNVRDAVLGTVIVRAMTTLMAASSPAYNPTSPD